LKRATGLAPGRLDFLGGVADYSGALVLETPIDAVTRVEITTTSTPAWTLSSRSHGRWAAPADPLLSTLAADGRIAREALDDQGAPAWAHYPLGCVWVFCRQTGWRPEGGLAFSISSGVPEGMGVASSAALEIATLRALEELSGTRLKGANLARLGQLAENEVVGAPCGLMDQLAAAYGKGGSLLQILCRPDILQPPVPLPKGVIVAGWASGVKHAVSGSPYKTARTATFAGKRMFEALVGGRWDFAAEIPPSLFARHAEKLPETIRGDRFLKDFEAVEDPLSVIERRTEYKVRAGLRFPIEESFRSELAACLLSSATGRSRGEHLRQVGELMLQSHAGYSSIGLGSPETDSMIDALLSVGPDLGIYGGRASGGGNGGVVVVLLEKSALDQLTALTNQLKFDGTGTQLILGKE
jgi:L-arabinokinase